MKVHPLLKLKVVVDDISIAEKILKSVRREVEDNNLGRRNGRGEHGGPRHAVICEGCFKTPASEKARVLQPLLRTRTKQLGATGKARR